jgi:FtsH-binding integral membrane protein
MKKWKYLFMILTMFCFCSLSGAQQKKDNVEMADLMRSNGRIYVVVAVIVVILIGLILYLVRLDKRISKMEKEK